MNNVKLLSEKNKLEKKYYAFKERKLSLDMSRGKPCKQQLDLSDELLKIIDQKISYKNISGVDVRNYGCLDGLPEAKEIFAELLEVPKENVIVGGNSSLQMMFETISSFFISGISNCQPWGKQKKLKFLCPVPGYDRHFKMLNYFGIEPVNIPMLETGPDMDMIEKILSEDVTVKGIWCVPKYSNPQGITYSDETVKRFSRLTPLASDFRIFWDNAYVVHDLYENNDKLLNLFKECEKNNNEDLPIMFCSTSKITFPGAGVAAMAASAKNMDVIKKHYSVQTIGFDKINQLRHVLFLKDSKQIALHMKKHRDIIKPKFEATLNILESEFAGLNVCKWTRPKGGYFISVDVLPGCAKDVVSMCRDAGLIITPAGATFPNGIDPLDSNIRIAPTYPPIDDLKVAMELFCTAVKLSAIKKFEKG